MTLILGGARSGKSSYALSLAKKYKKVAFIATCLGLDKEMQGRIRLHKESRPKHWETFEEPKDLARLIGKLGNSFDCILIDCLTLLVSNLVLSGDKQEQVVRKIKELLFVLNKKQAKIILVSNEVGLGLVPTNKLGRDFRDIAGRINQMVAKNANKVFFVVAGIPLKIKACLSADREGNKWRG
ncbi:MAG: bifunctional adenosylcobinamide kinase/adenosylcobinamide-phosphate guanylyltransferase [Candidatus Omnitrophica bacterium]|nr:bifunctional adenosylcobinamide kinase/adenosylcobinamide-phosphate guanylyltransferase [Candidatus Omnitrophota bacterium]MBU1923999.1 bifunctional adenosylcobinamide kinase/adenosylcobinamide-phosphate guanylyltransferase [Candidatus Omnitrophota bacterium]